MSDAVFNFEVVVVGGGPAGLAAACTAAESGCRVALVEVAAWLGGQIWRGGPQLCRESPSEETKILPEQKGSLPRQAQQWITRFRCSGATLLDFTTIIANLRPGVLLAERQDGPCEIHWKRLILATGARELFLPFPGWTLPGVMGPGGLQAMVKNGWPIQNQRIAIAGSGPLLLAAAEGLVKHGAKVISIAEQAPWSRVLGFGLGLFAHPAKLWQGAMLKARLTGVPYRCGVWPISAEGNDQVRRVTFTNGHRQWTEDCDALACGFGLVPNVELALSIGCELSQDFVRVDAWQATTIPNVYCAGEPTGIGGADCALVEGQIAGYAASQRNEQAQKLFSQREAWYQFREALARSFALRPEVKSLATGSTFVCRCEDVTYGQLRTFTHWRDAKLQTRCGMGSCQGRICGTATKVIFGWGMESVRPPVLPARVGSLISRREEPGSKGQIRNPKSEIREKAETRNPKNTTPA